MQRWSKSELRKALDVNTFEHVPQRSRDWHVARAYRLTASDAPLVCGELAHLSPDLQREEVLQRKLSVVKALNRGEAIPVTGNPRQQQAMAWGTANEHQGAFAYAQAAVCCLLDPEKLCSPEGVQVPVGDTSNTVVGLLAKALLPECGMRVRFEEHILAPSDLLLPLEPWTLTSAALHNRCCSLNAIRPLLAGPPSARAPGCQQR